MRKEIEKTEILEIKEEIEEEIAEEIAGEIEEEIEEEIETEKEEKIETTENKRNPTGKVQVVGESRRLGSHKAKNWEETNSNNEKVNRVIRKFPQQKERQNEIKNKRHK